MFHDPGFSGAPATARFTNGSAVLPSLLRPNPPYYVHGKNRRAGSCQRCTLPIPAGEGVLAKDKALGDRGWIVFHYDCAPPEVQAEVAGTLQEPTVLLDVSDENPGELVMYPVSRLGNLWGAYKEVADAYTRWNGQRGDRARQYGSLSDAATLQRELQAIPGLHVSVSEELAETLVEEGAKSAQRIAAATERANEIDLILAQMGAAEGRDMSLYDFQRNGVQWLASRQRALLADEQGTGKTIQSATAVPDGAPLIVVCPSVVKLNWKRELMRWRPNRPEPYVVEQGLTAKGRKAKWLGWPGPDETVIVNYELLPSAHELQAAGLPSDPLPGTYVVADECQKAKTLKFRGGALDTRPTARGGSSQMAVKLYQIGQRVLALGGAVWLLTGTPLLNRPDELWAILTQANLQTEAFGSWRRYKQIWNVEYEQIPGRRGGQAIVWGDPEPEVAEGLRRVMLRREKIDVLKDLPPKTVRNVEVPLTVEGSDALLELESQILSVLEREEEATRGFDVGQELAAYKAIDRRAEAGRLAMAKGKALTKKELKDLDVDLNDAEVELLDQTRSKSPFEILSRAREILARAKFPALMELIAPLIEAGEPLVVFSAHVEPLRKLAGLPGWALLDGSLSPKKRAQIVDAFQAGDLVGVAASIRASGTGITLTRSHICYFLDLDWVPANNLQAEDRVHRIGQFNPVEIVRLVGNHPIDHRVMSLLDHKLHLIRETVQAAAVRPGQFSMPSLETVQAAPLPELRLDTPEQEELIRRMGFARGPEDPDAERRRIEDQRERQRQQEQEERRLARLRPTDVQLADTGRRPPESPDEEWAAGAINELTLLDSDHARKQNLMGWAASDTKIGHQLNALIVGGYGLTDREWQDVLVPRCDLQTIQVPCLRMYRGQIGLPPSASSAELAEVERLQERRRKAALADAQRQADLEHFRSREGAEAPPVRVRGSSETFRAVYAADLRPGDVVVLDGPSFARVKKADPKKRTVRLTLVHQGGKKDGKSFTKRPRLDTPIALAPNDYRSPDPQIPPEPVMAPIPDGYFFVRTADSSLEDDDWGSYVVVVSGGRVERVAQHSDSVYSAPFDPGASESEVRRWLSYMAPEHFTPQTYNEVWTRHGWRPAVEYVGREAEIMSPPESRFPPIYQREPEPLPEPELPPEPDWSGGGDQMTLFNPRRRAVANPAPWW